MMHGNFILNSEKSLMRTDTDLYKIEIKFDLTPNSVGAAPLSKVMVGTELMWDGPLPRSKTFEFTKFLHKGLHSLEIELYHKPDIDPHQNLQISNLSFGQIHSPRFVWQGVYQPRYPEPWASQQLAQGIQLQSQLHNTDYLGWNGVWRLGFSVPIFTWIHKIENLGWIYD